MVVTGEKSARYMRPMGNIRVVKFPVYPLNAGDERWKFQLEYCDDKTGAKIWRDPPVIEVDDWDTFNATEGPDEE